MNLKKITLFIFILLFSIEVNAEETRSEAEILFEQGVELYNDNDFGGALASFQRSYELSHNWRILFNIGQTQWNLHRYSDAISTFESYLQLGGTAINNTRRNEVNTILSQLRSRVSFVRFNITPEGALLKIDGREEGISPIVEPIRLDIGIHMIDVTMNGYAPYSQELHIVGTQDEQVTINLEPLPDNNETIEQHDQNRVGREDLGSIVQNNEEIDHNLSSNNIIRVDTTQPIGTPWYRKWWVWTTMGVGAIAIAVIVALVVTEPFEASPGTTNDFHLP